MRTAAAATVLVSGLLALNSCGGTTTPATTIQGNVFASSSAGGAPVQGARVTATLGNDTESAITGPDGGFSLELNTARTAQAFTLTVEPPARSNLYASTYVDVSLNDYRSAYGAAGQLSIYLGTTRPSAALPGATPKRGCVAGLLRDIGGQPVVSNALNVVPTSGGTQVPRPLYDNCATEFSAVPAPIPNFAAGLATLPQAGETGLVIYGGSRVVRTDAQGRYLLPVQTTQNLNAVSGAMWAGNYDGTDTGNPETANAFFWSKFQYVPEVPVFTSGATDTRDLQLEAFDPATNPRVTTQAINYNAGAIETTGDIIISTSPAFEPAITSGTFPLGEYYTVNPTDSHSLRVPRLASDNQAQNVQVTSGLTRYNPEDFTFLGASNFTGWRDGTNLGEALNANFLAIPAPQTPALGSGNASRTPTLSWNAVPGARTYNVGLYRVTDDDVTPVWVGYTTATTIAVPLTLEAGAEYLWQVYTDDSTEMLDYIGKDPLRAEAARWKAASRLPGARQVGSALNTWRGRVAQGIFQATGQRPQDLVEPGAAYQRLQETGYRESYSQEFTFTTGN